VEYAIYVVTHTFEKVSGKETKIGYVGIDAVRAFELHIQYPGSKMEIWQNGNIATKLN
jgi:hypothetical protein